MKKALFKSILCTLLLMGCNDLLKEEKRDTQQDEITEEVIPDSVEIRLPNYHIGMWGDSVTFHDSTVWEYDSTDHSFSSAGTNLLAKKMWFNAYGKMVVRLQQGEDVYLDFSSNAEVYTWDKEKYKRLDRFCWTNVNDVVHYRSFNEHFFETHSNVIGGEYDTNGMYHSHMTDSVTYFDYEYHYDGTVKKRITTTSYNDSLSEEEITVEVEGIYTRYTPSILPDGDSTVTAIVEKGKIPQEVRGVFTGYANNVPVECFWKVGLDGQTDEYIWDEHGDRPFHSIVTYTTLKVATKDLGTPIPFPWE